MIKFSKEIYNYNGFKTLLGKVSLSNIAGDIDFSFIKCPRREYKAESKAGLAVKVFISFMRIVIEDIITNGNIFKLSSNRNAYMFVGDDWDDRESFAKKQNIFSFDKKKVLQIAMCNDGRVFNKLCIINKNQFKEIQDNPNRFKVDPSESLCI